MPMSTINSSQVSIHDGCNNVYAYVNFGTYPYFKCKYNLKCKSIPNFHFKCHF